MTSTILLGTLTPSRSPAYPLAWRGVVFSRGWLPTLRAAPRAKAPLRMRRGAFVQFG
jgi:hypothetical protein